MIETEENRLKRLRMRSWRRGTKEMDLILGRFADAELSALTEQALLGYEDLLSEDDNDLYLWISGTKEFPSRHGKMVARIRSYHRIG